MQWIAIVGTANERTIGHARDSAQWDQIDSRDAHVRRLGDGPVRAGRRDPCVRRDATLNLKLVELFHRVPLLLAPTIAGQPPVIGTSFGTVNGESSAGWVALTYPFKPHPLTGGHGVRRLHQRTACRSGCR